MCARQVEAKAYTPRLLKAVRWHQRHHHLLHLVSASGASIVTQCVGRQH